jgi:hypothetical protein
MTEITREGLIREIREIVASESGRHLQHSWISNRFYLPQRQAWDIGQVRAYAHQPLPAAASDPDRPVCGTTACVAGWAAILVAPEGSFLRAWSESIEFPDGTVQSVEGYARGVLELSAAQSDWLFYGARSRPEILRALDALLEDPAADFELLSDRFQPEEETL